MNRFSRIIQWTGMFLCLFVGLVQLPQLRAAPQQSGGWGPVPVGSWLGIAEAANPVPGFPTTVTMLLSFNQDGVLLGTDSTNFGVAGVLGSPAHGSWGRSGPHGVVGTFLWLQHDPDGNLTGYVKVRMAAHIEDFQTMSGAVYPEAFTLGQNPLAPDASGFPLGRFDFDAWRILPGSGSDTGD